MSDLPKSVGVPHRRAIRNYVKKLNEAEDKMDKQGAVKQKRSGLKRTRPAKPSNGRHAPEKPDQGLKQTDIVAFNQSAETAFVVLISRMLQEDGTLSYREALQEAAYELNISTETAKRYLVKHSARRAEFYCEGKSVTLRRT
jgi:hypothetical protein